MLCEYCETFTDCMKSFRLGSVAESQRRLRLTSKIYHSRPTGIKVIRVHPLDTMNICAIQYLLKYLSLVMDRPADESNLVLASGVRGFVVVFVCHMNFCRSNTRKQFEDVNKND